MPLYIQLCTVVPSSCVDGMLIPTVTESMLELILALFTPCLPNAAGH